MLSKHMNTSYLDIGEISPRERELLLSFVTDDLREQQKAIDASKRQKKTPSQHQRYRGING